MESKHALIALLALLCLGALGWMFWGGADAASVANWSEEDVVAVPEEEAELADELQIDGSTTENRSQVEGQDGSAEDPDEARPLITIKGRVVDKHKTPVAGAAVSLSAQGRGQRSRISIDVVTKGDGTFAFSGKGFSRLWVTLQVSHENFAKASAFKPFENAAGELDMGDITVVVGGTIVGSITDMQGHVVAGADAQLSSMDRGRGRGRWGRGRNGDNPVVNAGVNGIFRIEHVTPGRYRINAKAPHRQRRSEGPITVVDAQTERLDPIQLGPGFELKGVVYKADGKALPDADVNVRGSDRRSREESKKTNKLGEFAFDHLAPGEYSVQVRAEGYLTNRDHNGVKVTEAPPLAITMQPGLKISGVVVDSISSQPVTKYGARVRRVGGLPDPEADRRREQSTQLMAKLRELRGSGDGEVTPELQAQMDKLRAELGQLGGGFGRGRGGRDGGGRGVRGGRDAGGRGGRDGGGRGGRDGGGRGGRDGGGRGGRGRGGRGGFGGIAGFGRNRNSNLPGDTGDIENRPDGTFTFDGLEEGVYVVDIGSPDHQKLRSPRIELRKGVESPTLNLAVERGLTVSGVALSKADRKPLRNANIELRMVQEETPEQSRQLTPEEEQRRNQFRNMFQQFAGDGPRSTRLLGARTGPDGSFAIRNAPPGKYVVRAEADGHSTLDTKAFKLEADKPNVDLVLGALGVLEGRVSGIPMAKMSEAKVMAFSLPRNFRNADVNPDGTYQITDLEPGGYIVRAFMGDARSYIFRQMFRGLGSQDPANQQQTPIDVQVREGGKHRFNVTVIQNPTGNVVGQVMLNGRGAQGYRVSASKVETEAATEESGRGRGRGGFGRGGFGRNSATVDQKGNFKISNLEGGQYIVTVSAGGGRGRGGFGGGNVVSRQQIFVNPETDNQVPLVSISTGSLLGVVSIPVVETKSGEEETSESRRGRGGNGRVTLYQGVTAIPDPSQPGGDEVLRFTARIRDDKFEFKDLPTGDYLALLIVSGREAVTKTVYVGAGDETKIEMEAGGIRKPEPKAKPNEPGTNPAAGRAGRGRAGGAGAGGGNRRGGGRR